MTVNVITKELYSKYFDHLINGRRNQCAQIVTQLLDQDIPLNELYISLFQKSLYEIGQLWEINKISVAREHLVTAITESLLNLLYPKLFNQTNARDKAVIISCTANEFHQVGGKIISDVFEFHGWNAHFLGANTPIEHLLKHVDKIRPDMVGLSLSIYFNLPVLKKTIEALQTDFTSLDLLVGGQAFNWGDQNVLKSYQRLEYIPSIIELEKLIDAN